MELTADEFFDALRLIKPELTREDFEREWDEFQKFKAEHQRLKSVQ